MIKLVMRVLGALVTGVFGVLIGLAGLGALYEALASTQDAVRYPPPGRLVDVGGYRVHVLCMGQGSPTVLLDAWSGGWSTEWAPVQPALARTTRVCAWDRAGSGWSDLGTHDHSPSAYAAEMAAVLQAADIEGPYVLVAASYGGRVARLFASEHPDQVLGVVFVDAVHQDSKSPQDETVGDQERAFASVGNWVLGRLGIGRLLGAELVPLIDGPVGYTLPESSRELIAVIALRPKNLEGNARLAAHDTLDDALLRAAGTLGDRPVVVLTSEQSLERLQNWRLGQAQLATLSSRSTHLVVDGPHLIAWQHPDLVIQAVEGIVAQSRVEGAVHP